MASTDPAEPIAAAELHSCYMDHIRAALIGGAGEARDLLAQLNRGELLLCWSDAWLALRAPSFDGVARLSWLVDALHKQSEDYRRDSLLISAADCYWLAGKVTTGALQLATPARVNEVREAQAAQRRALYLERWQRQAEAREAAR